jgi:hypothetical protein
MQQLLANTIISTDFCGDSESVDVYIEELEYNSAGQDWYCTKSAE